jgi:GNAT superfamily N-acetyltransferase
MARDLLIRPAKQEDTGQILDLVRLSLGEGKIPRHIDYWMWKHHKNPFGVSPCLLAESNGRLVGLRVFMRWTWLARGATVPAVRAVDTATHPDWRGRGIFTRLTLALLERMETEGIAFVFNTPNSQSRPGYLKMGWVSVGRLSLWVCPLRPLKLIGSLLSQRDALRDAARGAQAGSSAQDLVEEPGFPRFLQTLPDRTDRFSTPRSSEYFQWRYVEIPGLEYRAVWCLEGDDGAVVVFRSKDVSGLRELRLCEVLVGDTGRSRRMARDLLRALVRKAEAHYATGMAVTGTPELRVLLRSGFLPAPRMGSVMTVRPLNDVTNGLDPLRRSDWQLAIGDLELF